MKAIVRIVAYVVLIACVLGFGYGFVKRIPHARDDATYAGDPTNTAPQTNAPATPQTNIVAVSTNAGGIAAPPKKSLSNWGTFLGLFLFSSICLGMLTAYDLAHFFAHRAQNFVFDESLVVEKDPEYEEAEKLWANGKPLEAVQLLRDFLKKNPRAQYTALRIAEIYEKDLGNYLAAALEYEEILKKKLPDERWGWAAIHLANLYSGKLNKVAQAQELLHRIAEDYPKTGAAKKARERLGLPEPIVIAPSPPEPAFVEEDVEEEEPEPEEEPPPKPEPSAPTLPPGFRPKD